MAERPDRGAPGSAGRTPATAARELTTEQKALLRGSQIVPRLARRMARRTHYLTHDELVSIGNESEVKAALRFDPLRGVPFRAFAFACVHLDMKRAILEEAEHQRRTAPPEMVFEYAEQAQDRGDLFADSHEDSRRHLHEFLSGALAAIYLAFAGEASQAPTEVDIAAHIDAAKRRERARAHIAAMGEKGELLKLRYFDGLEWPAVAAKLGISIASAGREHVLALQILAARVRSGRDP
ncbi:MAG: sigma factor [Polyangiaceae bacterium]